MTADPYALALDLVRNDRHCCLLDVIELGFAGAADLILALADEDTAAQLDAATIEEALHEMYDRQVRGW